jgi:hypothetical protein
MARLTFDQLANEFENKGFSLQRENKGYWTPSIGDDAKFKNLTEAKEWLDNQQVKKVETDEETEETEEIATTANKNETDEIASALYWERWEITYNETVEKAIIKVQQVMELEQLEREENENTERNVIATVLEIAKVVNRSVTKAKQLLATIYPSFLDVAKRELTKVSESVINKCNSFADMVKVSKFFNLL